MMIKFLNCQIKISKKIFLPRKETEYWTKKAIEEIKKRKGRLKVLDIFAGSGCIGIAVLKNIERAKVDFADLSQKAISQIKENLSLNQIPSKRYKIFLSDVFKKIKGKYDFILANPPYVAEERISKVSPWVLENEPKMAILAGKRGLKFIKKFLKGAKKHLKKGGLIFMELDPKEKRKIEEILKKEGYQNFSFFKDQFKKIRFLKAKFKN